jgi:hypothetical protein
VRDDGVAQSFQTLNSVGQSTVDGALDVALPVGGPGVVGRVQSGAKPISFSTKAGFSFAETAPSKAATCSANCFAPCRPSWSSRFAIPVRQSRRVGVGYSFVAECRESALPRCLPASKPSVRGVGHSGEDPDPVATVRGVDGDSRNNGRPCGVVERLQVSQQVVETHLDEPRHVLNQEGSGPDGGDQAAHRRPEMPVILLAQSLPGL